MSRRTAAWRVAALLGSSRFRDTVWSQRAGSRFATVSYVLTASSQATHSPSRTDA